MRLQVRLIQDGIMGLLRSALNDLSYAKVFGHCEDPDEIWRRSNPSLTCQNILMKTSYT